MRKAFIAAALLGTVATALPAAAQSYGYPGQSYGDRYDRGNGYGYGQQGSQRVWQLREAVERLAQQGRLDRRETVYFRRSVEQLVQLDRRYRYDGYSQYERRDIDQRAADLTRALRGASEGGWGNGYRDDDRGDRRDDDRRRDWRDDDDDYRR